MIETTIPRTRYGQEEGEWAKILDDVDEKAIDANGFHGEWCQRGAPGAITPGSLVLECAGYRTKADKSRRRNRLMVLWYFDGEDWVEEARSKERDWALFFRDQARELLEGG